MQGRGWCGYVLKDMGHPLRVSWVLTSLYHSLDYLFCNNARFCLERIPLNHTAIPLDLGQRMTSDMAIDCLVDWNGHAFEVQAWEAPKVLVYQSAMCNYHNDHSQAGSSQPICGLVSLNCARLVFELMGEGRLSGDLLEQMLSPAMVNVSAYLQIARITFPFRRL